MVGRGRTCAEFGRPLGRITSGACQSALGTVSMSLGSTIRGRRVSSSRDLQCPAPSLCTRTGGPQPTRYYVPYTGFSVDAIPNCLSLSTYNILCHQNCCIHHKESSFSNPKPTLSSAKLLATNSEGGITTNDTGSQVLLVAQILLPSVSYLVVMKW